ncbi:MAG: hypothetical protein ACR2P0_19275 [Acidimicrobiales bacterium]
MDNRLENGDRLPSIMGTDLEGNQVDIVETVAGHWAAVILYRGAF